MTTCGEAGTEEMLAAPDLLAGAELGQVHLVAGAVLEEVHGRQLVSQGHLQARPSLHWTGLTETQLNQSSAVIYSSVNVSFFLVNRFQFCVSATIQR